MAAAQLRAPLYEDKVVDYLFDKAEVTERTVTKEELEAAIEAEDGDLKPHVHGPDCGHDHDEKPKAKKAAPKKKAEAEDAPVAEEAPPAEEAAPKKAAPKKAAAKKDVAEDAVATEEAPAAEAAPKKKAPAKKAAAKAE